MKQFMTFDIYVTIISFDGPYQLERARREIEEIIININSILYITPNRIYFRDDLFHDFSSTKRNKKNLAELKEIEL